MKLRTPENADRICALLAEGHTLRQIAREVGCDASAIAHWLREDQDAGGVLSQRYARAKEIGCERMAEEIREIADSDCTVNGEPNNALVQQARLKVDARKWLLSKMLPKKYGDRVVQELTSDPDRPVVTMIQLVPVAPAARLPKDDETAQVAEATAVPLRVLSRP